VAAVPILAAAAETCGRSFEAHFNLIKLQTSKEPQTDLVFYSQQTRTHARAWSGLTHRLFLGCYPFVIASPNTKTLIELPHYLIMGSVASRSKPERLEQSPWCGSKAGYLGGNNTRFLLKK
jgi:hypothetical protein